MSGVVPSPAVAEKALRLLEQQRLWLQKADVALVHGDTDSWIVTAYPHGVHCNCHAGANLDPVSCSHKVAAQIAWAES